jgi:hypothetical protein
MPTENLPWKSARNRLPGCEVGEANTLLPLHHDAAIPSIRAACLMDGRNHSQVGEPHNPGHGCLVATGPRVHPPPKSSGPIDGLFFAAMIKTD